MGHSLDHSSYCCLVRAGYLGTLFKDGSESPLVSTDDPSNSSFKVKEPPDMEPSGAVVITIFNIPPMGLNIGKYMHITGIHWPGWP